MILRQASVRVNIGAYFRVFVHLFSGQEEQRLDEYALCRPWLVISFKEEIMVDYNFPVSWRVWMKVGYMRPKVVRRIYDDVGTLEQFD